MSDILVNNEDFLVWKASATATGVRWVTHADKAVLTAVLADGSMLAGPPLLMEMT